jgi:hypothetical protein
MIPRVLFRLFHQLEASAANRSVKISFVELYHEEFRGLRASEMSVPAESTQPMGKHDPADNQAGFEIFDDPSKALINPISRTIRTTPFNPSWAFDPRHFGQLPLASGFVT